MRKGKDPEQDPDPDPYLWLMDPDPGSPKNMRIRIPNTEKYNFRWKYQYEPAPSRPCRPSWGSSWRRCGRCPPSVRASPPRRRPSRSLSAARSRPHLGASASSAETQSLWRRAGCAFLGALRPSARCPKKVNAEKSLASIPLPAATYSTCIVWILWG